MHAYIHAYIYTHIHKYVRTYIHIYIIQRISGAKPPLPQYTSMTCSLKAQGKLYLLHTHIHIHIQTCIHACIHTYIHTYTHTHTHTHTHTYVRKPTTLAIYMTHREVLRHILVRATCSRARYLIICNCDLNTEPWQADRDSFDREYKETWTDGLTHTHTHIYRSTCGHVYRIIEIQDL
jgi:hypothetical protein